MLAEAAKHGLYEELHEGDITAFLAAEQRRFPVVLAGDVLPYFGDLASVLPLAAGRLEVGGRFVFTVEHLADDGTDPPPWRLGSLGRYAHGEAHVRAAAAGAGLHVAALRRETMRLEQGEPVHGLLVILERPPA